MRVSCWATRGGGTTDRCRECGLGRGDAPQRWRQRNASGAPMCRGASGRHGCHAGWGAAALGRRRGRPLGLERRWADLQRCRLAHRLPDGGAAHGAGRALDPSAPVLVGGHGCREYAQRGRVDATFGDGKRRGGGSRATSALLATSTACCWSGIWRCGGCMPGSPRHQARRPHQFDRTDARLSVVTRGAWCRLLEGGRARLTPRRGDAAARGDGKGEKGWG